jgi:hypothetical protein
MLFSPPRSGPAVVLSVALFFTVRAFQPLESGARLAIQEHHSETLRFEKIEEVTA